MGFADAPEGWLPPVESKVLGLDAADVARADPAEPGGRKPIPPGVDKFRPVPPLAPAPLAPPPHGTAISSCPQHGSVGGELGKASSTSAAQGMCLRRRQC